MKNMNHELYVMFNCMYTTALLVMPRRRVCSPSLCKGEVHTTKWDKCGETQRARGFVCLG